MATNFPTSLDVLTNPQGTDSVAAVPHAAQHANANDAIEAIEGELGTNPKGAKATVKARLDDVDTEIATKAPIASPTFTGTVTIPSGSAITGVPYLATANTFTGGVQQITTASAATTGLIIKGAASQTADLQQWQNSAGTVLSRVRPDGQIGIGQTLITSTNFFVNNSISTTHVVATIRGAASQTANLTEWQDSSGTASAYVTSNGSFKANSIRANTVSFLGVIGAVSTSATDIGLVVRGAASQTANLQEWQDSAGTVLAKVDPYGSGIFNGNLVVGTSLFVGVGASSTSTQKAVIANTVATQVALTLKGFASQTANLQEWQNSDGTVLSRINSAGHLVASSRSIFGGKTSIVSGMIIAAVSQEVAATPILARGASGQTANLTEWQNSDGTIIARVSSGGAFVTSAVGVFGAQSNTPNAQLYVLSNSITNPTFVAKTIASQTSNLTEWQDSSGGPLSFVGPTGVLTLNNGNSTPPATYSLIVKRTSFFDTGDLAAVGIVVRARSSQTANLQEWQNSAGSVLSKVTSDGSINTSGASGIYSTYGFSAAGGLSIGNGVSNIHVHSTYGMGISSASGNVTDPTLVVKLGSINQTGNLQEWHNSTGTILANVSSSGSIFINSVGTTNDPFTVQRASATRFKVDPYGNVFAGALTVGNVVTSIAGTSAGIYTGLASNIGLIVRGVTSQTANLQEWQNNSGTILNSISASGTLNINTSGTGTINLGDGVLAKGPGNGFTFNSDINILDGKGLYASLGKFTNVTGITTVPLTAKAISGQTANLQEWQDSTGAVLSSISASGGFTIPSLTVSGDFTVNGTTTNINTTNLIVEDKNITIADVATPTDTTADGAGITIKGATDKTFSWVQSTGRFTSSEPIQSSAFVSTDVYASRIGSTVIGTATLNTNSDTGGVLINTAGVANKGLIVKGAASQTANLQEWQNSTGSVLASVDAYGSASFGGNNTLSASLGVGVGGNPAQKGIVIRGAASQTANLTEWQDSTGYLISRVDSAGSHWINAAPATSGSVETSSAYLYLTSNRWTGSASSAEVFGLNNFRFGGAGAAGAFALHLKPASSANAYLSIAGDSSRSVGVNVQYPSATSGYGQFGVQIQDASYKGIVVKAAASQTANLQEWQNSAGTVLASITPLGGITVSSNITQSSSGRTFIGGAVDAGAFLNVGIPTASRQGIVVRANASQTGNLQEWQNSSGAVLSSIDASGSFTSVSQPIQVAGSTYGFSQTVSTQYGATAYWKIATLPPTTLSTCDQINIEAMLGTWASTGKTKYEIMMGNRDAFAYKYTRFGDNATQVRIQSYTEANGSVSVYVYSENTYTTFAYNITLAAVTSGGDIGATIYKNPTVSTTAPTGTKSFDTAEPATYIPLIGMNNAGLLSTKSAIFNPTSASAVPLIAQGATSQTADLQQWKNSTGTTYLNVTNAGAMISNGGVTISSNPTINAYGAAMKIASGVNTYPMLIVQGAASQSANLQEWQDSAAVVRTQISPSGVLTLRPVTYAANQSAGIEITDTTNSWSTAKIRLVSDGSGNPRLGIFAPSAAFENISVQSGSVGIRTAAPLAILHVSTAGAASIGTIIQGAASQSANLQEWQNSSATVLAKVDANGNFSAISKSFDIPHPTKENMRLRYASLEGNEHGVYIRGNTKENIIELPEYWTNLVDESTITVSLTSVGKFQKVYVEKIEGNKIYIGGRVKEISYAVFGERKDIDKLIVEY